MRKQQNHKKNFIPLLFCSVLVLQQSVCDSSFASTITDASGNAIAKDPIDSATVGKDVFNLRPEAFNGKYGFRQFKDFNITEGDVVNFLYRALQLDTESGVQNHRYFDIETFVNFVQNGGTINGIVNTMRELGDTSMNAGNLVFISPNGMMVGSTGVLNVGSLQVYTPSQTSFDAMRTGLPDHEINTTFSDGTTTALAQNVTNTFDPTNAALYTGSGAVTINGRVASRGDITLSGGQVNVGNGGLLLAGIGNDKTYITTNNGADVLFNNLVNADNMNSANSFASANGKIVIQSNIGTDIAQNAKVRNYNTAANSSVAITNTGANGIKIAGEVSNPNGTMTITNSAGALNETSTGLIKNKGTLTVTNNGSGTGINLDGTVVNTGDMTITNETGANGLSIGGDVTNNTGIAEVLNKVNGLDISGTVTSNGTSLNITNEGSENLAISGNVYNNSGTATITNTSGSTSGGLDVSGLVQNKGISVTLNNAGNSGLNISGTVDNDNGTVSVLNSNGGLNVVTGGTVTNDGSELIMTNDGAGGFSIDGSVINNKGTATLKNNKNKFVVNSRGTVTNRGTKLEMTNSGTNGMLVAGKVYNYAGDAVLTNTDGSSNGDFEISGLVQNDGNSLSINNAGAGGLNITGLVDNNSGAVTATNTNGGLNVATNGEVVNDGTKLTMLNSGANGFNVDGKITNNNGTASLENTNAGLVVSPTGNVNSKGSALTVKNTGANGMNIQGLVTHKNKVGIVNFINENSNMKIGHTSNEFNIDSDADVNITVKNGNLLNNGVAKTLIKTTEDADLITTVTDGSVGLEVGPCDGGVCTGVGPAERDLTKSINTEIDGTITIDNTGNGALVNLASLDKDMNVNRIHSDGRIILLADDKTNKGATPYSILNKSENNLTTPNLKGSGISAIASGNIGANESDKITFLQTGVNVDIANEADDASQPHDLYETPLINGKAAGTENAEGIEFLAIGDINAKGLDNGTKVDTKVCTISSREGSVNVEFSGNTYIRDITAQNEVNIVDRGSEMYIENLGGAPSRYAESGDYYGDYTGIVPEKATVKVLDMGTKENPNLVPNSTLVIKNGTLNGQGSISHPNMDQDLTVTADNAYVGGYYFNMGKHRMPGLSSVTPDDRTNTLVNTNPDTDKPVSIRGRAVRPDDVTATGEPEEVRIYYYGYDPDNGETPDDAGPDGDIPGSGQRDDETFDPDKENGDDLVVPDPDPEPDPDPDPDPEPGMPDVMSQTWKKEYNDYIEVIDKRQYMRFDTEASQNQVVFNSDSQAASGILNISRGGVQLSHNKSLKVGDVVPVHIKYGDVEVNTEVKVVSTTDKTAGAEFVNLDLATKNKILYLSLLKDQGELKEGQYYAEVLPNSDTLSTTGVDD